MNKLLTAIINLIFPPKCLFCKKLLNDDEFENGFCIACGRSLYSLNIGYPEDDKIYPMDRFYSPLEYFGQTREAMLRFKFGDMRSFAIPFARMMYRVLQEENITDIDAVSWIPISKTRFNERGYDQSKMLAKDLSDMAKLPLISALEKISENTKQSRLTAEERTSNVVGVYQVKTDISGMSLLLVDDIYTTGATMREAARTLMSAGAVRVVGITATKTMESESENKE